MAQKVLIQLTDDLDGSVATTSVTFTYRGDSYEIDLSDRNVAAFDEALDKFTRAARRVGRSGKPSSARAPRKESTHDAAAVREWALTMGFVLSERGRIPSHVFAAYEAAIKAEAATG